MTKDQGSSKQRGGESPTDNSRRQFLKTGALTGVGGAAAVAGVVAFAGASMVAGAPRAEWLPTPLQGEGPFYPYTPPLTVMPTSQA